MPGQVAGIVLELTAEGAARRPG